MQGIFAISKISGLLMLFLFSIVLTNIYKLESTVEGKGSNGLFMIESKSSPTCTPSNGFFNVISS
jgi:hypothetical protein